MPRVGISARLDALAPASRDWRRGGVRGGDVCRAGTAACFGRPSGPGQPGHEHCLGRPAMNTLRTWKIIGGLVILFGLGGVSGATYTVHRGGWAGHAGATEKWSERWFMQTADCLQGREGQMKMLRPMLDEMQRQLREVQTETTTRANAIVHQTGRRMWEVLDETQRERYRALEREQKLLRQPATESAPFKSTP